MLLLREVTADRKVGTVLLQVVSTVSHLKANMERLRVDSMVPHLPNSTVNHHKASTVLSSKAATTVLLLNSPHTVVNKVVNRVAMVHLLHLDTDCTRTLGCLATVAGMVGRDQN